MEEKKVKVRYSIRSVFGNWMRDKFVLPGSNNSGSAAFTLIEVLIVIALIGILSGAFLVLVNPKVQLEKARDSQRKSHLRQIQSALEVYRADCGAYPSPASGNKLNSPLTGTCNGPLVTYMQSVPVDPETDLAYYYCTYPSCTQVQAGRPYLYSIYACLEVNEGSDGSGAPCAASMPFIRYQD